MTHRSTVMVGLLSTLCAALVFGAAPTEARPSPAGQYLHNVYYDGCLTDLGENVEVELLPCKLNADGYIAADQRWDHVYTPQSGGFIQLVSGLGHSLEFPGIAFGKAPMVAEAVVSGRPQTVWQPSGGAGNALVPGGCGATSCFLLSYNTPLYLMPLQHTQPMQASIGFTTMLDNFQNDMVLWTMGP
ncbi:hypothetical protein VMT65_12310 [Nocardia sp. CDC153]|uniref:hypothetical protein n=1 Tax=Nocardia sp. CDC153 TaxID=3112167 RepID=UPI002DB93654|nr:hypothetical protein [Nocardia sp. CDC153]MEC3953814.1 hypothetical protein [Nocardia sp. CDC153]